MDLFKLALTHPQNRYDGRTKELYQNIILLQEHLSQSFHGDKSTDREKFDILMVNMRRGSLPEHPLEECPVYNVLTDLEKRVFQSASPCTYDDLRMVVTLQMEHATLYFLTGAAVRRPSPVYPQLRSSKAVWM